MNIVVVGAGAVGSLVATDLARAGEDVTVLLKPGTVPEAGSLKTQVAEGGHETRWAIIPATESITELPDLVILCVKAPDLAAAAQTVAAQAPTAPVLALHAAPEGDHVMQEALGRPALSGIFTGCAEYLAPGMARVAHPGFALDAPGDPRLAPLQRALSVTSAGNLRDLRWAYTLVGLPQALAAPANQPLAALAEDRAMQHAATAMLIEAARVFAKANIIPADLPGVDIPKLRRLHTMPGIFTGRAVRNEPQLFQFRGDLRDPLAQSLQRHRPTEIDALHGAIARLGEQTGIPTPALRRVIDLVHEVERTGTFLPSDKLRQVLGKL